ncbi:MAG: sodium:proton antiporter [Magnetococcales bacterium]|nr:sodium:proton antiporter [Magnetococcales bacterium]
MFISLFSLLLFAVCFVLMHLGILDRRVAMMGGGIAFVLSGWLVGFYLPIQALEAVYFETLALIFGMSMISATLAKAGWFTLLAQRTATCTNGNSWLALILLTLTTYTFSLFVNNLATMMVMLPITLSLCRATRMNTVPILIAEIIASNLGGASMMMGDFPNMIISSAGNLHFLDFIGGMMPACLLELAALLLFFQWRKTIFSTPSPIPALRPAAEDALRLIDAERNGTTPYDARLARIGGVTLVLVLIGFVSGPWHGVRPGTIALLAGVILMFLSPFPGKTLWDAAGLGDMIFFLGLFLMVGGLKGAGVLEVVEDWIVTLGANQPTLELLALMWIAALLTPFLNAGPATAFFVPVALEMNGHIPGQGVWWALSLGVLAGSSMALTGATAGSVASTHLERDWQRHPEEILRFGVGNGLHFRNYLAYGLPVALLFLCISTVYVALMF